MIYKNVSSPKNFAVLLLFLFAGFMPTQTPLQAEGYTDVALTIGTTTAVSTSIFTAAAYYAYKQACKKSLQLPAPTFAAFMQSIFAKAHKTEELKKVFTTKKNLKNTKKLMGTEELHPKLMLLALACEVAIVGSCFHAYKNFKAITIAAENVAPKIPEKVQTQEIGINTEEIAPVQPKTIMDTIVGPDDVDDVESPLSRETTGTFDDGDPGSGAAKKDTDTTEQKPAGSSGAGQRDMGTKGNQTPNKTREYPELINETFEATLKRIGLTDLGPRFNYIWLFPTPRERIAAFEYVIKTLEAKPILGQIILPKQKDEIIKILNSTTDFVEFKVLRALLELQKKLQVPTKKIELTPLKTQEQEEARRAKLNATPPPQQQAKYKRSVSAPADVATTSKGTTEIAPGARARSQSPKPTVISRSSSPSPLPIPTSKKLKIKK